jgi:hypothetical protein
MVLCILRSKFATTLASPVVQAMCPIHLQPPTPLRQHISSSCNKTAIRNFLLD